MKNTKKKWINTLLIGITSLVLILITLLLGFSYILIIIAPIILYMVIRRWSGLRVIPTVIVGILVISCMGAAWSLHYESHLTSLYPEIIESNDGSFSNGSVSPFRSSGEGNFSFSVHVEQAGDFKVYLVIDNLWDWTADGKKEYEMEEIKNGTYHCDIVHSDKGIYKMQFSIRNDTHSIDSPVVIGPINSHDSQLHRVAFFHGLLYILALSTIYLTIIIAELWLNHMKGRWATHGSAENERKSD
jgi:hypothetical protein